MYIYLYRAFCHRSIFLRKIGRSPKNQTPCFLWVLIWHLFAIIIFLKICFYEVLDLHSSGKLAGAYGWHPLILPTRNSVWHTVSLLKWIIDVIQRAYSGWVCGQSGLYNLQQWLRKFTYISKSESISIRFKWNVIMISKKIKYF